MPNPAEQTHPFRDALEVGGVPASRVRCEIGALTDRGKVREGNEDAYVVFRTGRFLERLASSVPEAELPPRIEDGGYLMVVADGLGGHEAGDVASRSAMLTTLDFIVRSPKWVLKLDDPKTRKAEINELLARSREYLDTVHASLREQAAGDSRLAGMGTTLTLAYSVGIDLFVLHVGDSKAYHLRGSEMRKITRDHTVAQEYADLGVISQQEVSTHRMQHVLTRAVGGPSEKLQGDMHHVQVADGDRLLLCSDGLTDMATEDEIAEVLRAHPESDAACRVLVDLALERGGRDNVTVIVAGYHVT
jgi:PPM family protein phosphatase